MDIIMYVNCSPFEVLVFFSFFFYVYSVSCSVFMHLHPKISLRAQPDRASVVSEQALHCIPSDHFDKAFLWGWRVFQRRTLRIMCVVAGTLFAYLEGSAVGQELEEKIKVYKSANITQESWLMTNFIDDRKQQISSCVLFCQDTTPAMVKCQLYVTRP